MNRISVRAPCSSANLGPGFDVFALALDFAWDEVTLIKRESGIRLQISSSSSESVPEVLAENVCGIVAVRMVEEFCIRSGLEIELVKNVPVGVGLGSSGASAACTAFAINQLFQLELSDSELVHWAAKGEGAIAGAEHADNVSASLFGGFVIAKPDFHRILRVEPPRNLGVCICIPDLPRIERKTAKLRRVLPQNVPLDRVVANVGNSCSLVYGMMNRDVEIIGASMVDSIVEPARALFIPGYLEVKRAALEVGAAGVAISGAGPTLLAIYDMERVEPRHLAERMATGFMSVGVKAKSYTCNPAKGAHIIPKSGRLPRIHIP